MTCETWRDAIQSALDGALPAGERAALAEHLRLCETCRAYEHAMAPVFVGLDAMRSGPGAPAELLDRLGLAPTPRRRRPDPWRRWGLVAAAVGLLTGVGSLQLLAPSTDPGIVASQPAELDPDAQMILAWIDPDAEPDDLVP